MRNHRKAKNIHAHHKNFNISAALKTSVVHKSQRPVLHSRRALKKRRDASGERFYIKRARNISIYRKKSQGRGILAVVFSSAAATNFIPDADKVTLTSSRRCSSLYTYIGFSQRAMPRNSREPLNNLSHHR